MKKKYLKRYNKGVTMIALVVTIVILLILAGITIGVLIGENGLIKNTIKGKTNSEIAKEKEVVEISTIKAIEKEKYGNLEKQNLQESIDETIGENSAKVYEDGENFLILFDTKRIYTVDKDGNIIEMQENFTNPNRKFTSQLEEEKYGTEENPYEINCIEDLVDLSYVVNGIKVENGELSKKTTNGLAEKYIILNRNLNFTSELSYENSTRTDYGDINGNGEIEELLIELTTGKGWIPIGEYSMYGGLFYGNFYGNNNEIRNLYINNEEETSYSGLFGITKSREIKNLGVQGNIYCNSDTAGGIVGKIHVSNVNNISNCYFEGNIDNINTMGNTGGIVGYINSETNINNCYNKGSIKGNNTDYEVTGVGGIVGYVNATTIIENSFNEAKVIGVFRVGGISGNGNNIKISNSYNTEEIEGKQYVGGIVGYSAQEISKCYNTGAITATSKGTGGIAGAIYSGNNKKIYQCYNSGIVEGTSNTGGILGYIYSSSYLTIEECYNLKEVTGTTRTAGIVGNISGVNAHIVNCYNIGKISGTEVAGIARGDRKVETAKIVSSYNVGELNATNKYGVLAKYGNYGETYNSYYLESCGATDTIAVSITEESLKTLANTLDKTFTIDDEQNTITINEESQGVWGEDTNNINNGYPILKWQ